MKNTMYSFLLLLLIFAVIGAGDIESDSEKVIKKAFPDHQIFEFIKTTISGTIRKSIETEFRQSFFTDYIYLSYICKDDSLAGLAILDNVYGKSRPITFLTVFDGDATVKSTAVIRYREPYGGAVAGKGWLSQFVGLTAKDTQSMSRKIDVISGATISSRSLTLGIRKLSKLALHILERSPKECSQFNQNSVDLTD